MRNLIFLIGFFALSSSPIGFAGTIKHDVEDDKYVEYGKLHKCVLKLSGVLEENGEEVNYYGSCTAISGSWVLTAAHVVSMSKTNFLILEVEEEGQIKEKKVLVQKKIIHPNFRYGSYGPSDMALCKLEEDIGLEGYPELYTERNELGKVCGMAGYGKTGTGITGAVKVSDIKRAGSNKVDSVSDDSLYCIMSRDRPTELEFLISHGDSGGGLFIDGKLAGVHSSVKSSNGKPDSNYGDESCHVRVSKPEHLEWIISTMEEN